MPRLARPRSLVLACLAVWLLLAPAALRALDLNVIHLALRDWNPLSDGSSTAPLSTIPLCTDAPALDTPGACDRATALTLLAHEEIGREAQAVRLLARPGTRRPLDLYFLGLAEQRAGDAPAAWRAWARIGAEDRILARGVAWAQQGDATAATQEFSAIL